MMRAGLCLVAVLTCGVGAQPTVTALPYLESAAESSSAWCFVTDSGSNVFGHAWADGVFYGHRWDLGAGGEPTPFPDTGNWIIKGINHDGSVVVLLDGSFSAVYQWVSGLGVIALDQGDGARVSGINRDGRVILGEQPAFSMCQWVDGVFEQIGPEDAATVPHVCSADGSIVFGHDYGQSFRGFVWDSSDDSYTLPLGPTPAYDAYVVDVNERGTVGVGMALEDPTVFTDSGDGLSDLALPCIYADGEFANLPTDQGFYQYFASSMDESAGLIGGNANRSGTVDELVALVWVDSGTPQTLSDYLLSQGVNTTGWEFVYITDITADGRFIVGTGHYNNQITAFIIDLSEGDSCLVDFTNDGVLDLSDIFAFIDALLGNQPAADFTGDGEFNFFDVSAFLSAFSAGCP